MSYGLPTTTCGPLARSIAHILPEPTISIIAAGPASDVADRLEEVRRLGSLSPRQREVALAIAEGLSTNEIANIPGRKCSRKTVETHIAHIITKLGMPGMNRVHICRLMVRHGFLKP